MTVPPFIRTYKLESQREGEEHSITLALYESDVSTSGLEAVATWNNNGVAQDLVPETFRPMSIRTLIPSHKLEQIFQSLFRQAHIEWEEENNG